MEFHEKSELSLMKEARGFERDCVGIWIGWRKISERESCGSSKPFISSSLIFFVFTFASGRGQFVRF